MRYDGYDLELKRFYVGAWQNYGLELVTKGWYINEPYEEVAVWEHEYFVQGRHEHPNPNCLWAKKSRLLDAVLSEYEGKLKPTGRTTKFYGKTYYEVMPDPDWFVSLPKSFY